MQMGRWASDLEGQECSQLGAIGSLNHEGLAPSLERHGVHGEISFEPNAGALGLAVAWGVKTVLHNNRGWLAHTYTCTAWHMATYPTNLATFEFPLVVHKGGGTYTEAVYGRRSTQMGYHPKRGRCVSGFGRFSSCGPRG